MSSHQTFALRNELFWQLLLAVQHVRCVLQLQMMQIRLLNDLQCTRCVLDLRVGTSHSSTACYLPCYIHEKNGHTNCEQHDLKKSRTGDTCLYLKIKYNVLTSPSWIRLNANVKHHSANKQILTVPLCFRHVLS